MRGDASPPCVAREVDERRTGALANPNSSRAHGELTVLPQVHLRIGAHVRVQLGVGAHHTSASARWGAVAGVRLIVER